MELHRLSVAEAYLVQAECALLDGDARQARRWLTQGSAPADIEDPRVACRHAVVAAALAVAEGDPAAATDLLDAAATRPGWNDEMLVRALAVRLQAQARGAGIDADSAAAARRWLATPNLHALAALHLHAALRPAEQDGGAAWRARIDALTGSLAGHPDLARAFAARWRGLPG